MNVVDGMIRICGAVPQRHPMATVDTIGITRELLRLPWIRSLYEGDALAPSSAYYLLAQKSA